MSHQDPTGGRPTLGSRSTCVVTMLALLVTSAAGGTAARASGTPVDGPRTTDPSMTAAGQALLEAQDEGARTFGVIALIVFAAGAGTLAVSLAGLRAARRPVGPRARRRGPASLRRSRRGGAPSASTRSIRAGATPKATHPPRLERHATPLAAPPRRVGPARATDPPAARKASPVATAPTPEVPRIPPAFAARSVLIPALLARSSTVRRHLDAAFDRVSRRLGAKPAPVRESPDGRIASANGTHRPQLDPIAAGRAPTVDRAQDAAPRPPAPADGGRATPVVPASGGGAGIPSAATQRASRPPVAAPPWAEPVTAPEAGAEACRVRLWDGYVKKQFYADPSAGGPFVATSPFFRVARGCPVAGSPEARRAHAALVSALREQGWEVTGRSVVPWEVELRRPAMVQPQPAGPASPATTPVSP